MTDKTTAGIDLDKLQRFNMRGGLMNPEPWGLYVRYEDVAALIQQAAPDERRNIAEVKRSSDMGLSIRFLSARACSAFERFLAEPAATPQASAIPAHACEIGLASAPVVYSKNGGPDEATQQAGAAVVSEAFLTGAHAEFSEALPPGSLTSLGHRHVVNALRSAIRSYIEVSRSSSLVATTASASDETITVQEAWEAAGGNPGIKATKQELLDALRVMDEAVDECDDKHGKAPQQAGEAVDHSTICHDYSDPTLACSSCGLMMGESRTLGHIKLGILAVSPAATTASASDREKFDAAIARADRPGAEILADAMRRAPATSRKATPLGISDAMVDAYLAAQREQVERKDKRPFGVVDPRAACRAGLRAALAQQGAAPGRLIVQRYTNDGEGNMLENPEGVWCYYQDAVAQQGAAQAAEGDADLLNFMDGPDFVSLHQYVSSDKLFIEVQRENPDSNHRADTARAALAAAIAAAPASQKGDCK
jgi:hypothetical protein